MRKSSRLLPPLSTHAFNCRRAQLRTEEPGFEASYIRTYAITELIKCGYYSRAATIRGAATIRVNTVNKLNVP